MFFGWSPGVWAFSGDVSERSIRSIFIGIELYAYENGTDKKFRNVGTKTSDAGRLPRRTQYGIQHTAKVWNQECSVVCLFGPLVSLGMIAMKPGFIAVKYNQESHTLAYFTKLSWEKLTLQNFWREISIHGTHSYLPPSCLGVDRDYFDQATPILGFSMSIYHDILVLHDRVSLVCYLHDLLT